MPMITITEEETVEALRSMADSLDSLLITNNVPKEVRAVLGHVGVQRLPNLANYESTEERFREALAKDLGLEAVDAKSRILIYNLIESWKSARNRLKTRDDEDAMARAQGRPAPMDDTTFTNMRRTWERAHQEKEDYGFPSRYYINKRIRQLEIGELRAEKLSEVTSVAEGGDDDDDRDLDLVITANSFRATRKSVSIALPANNDTEALRHRINLMQIQWDVAQAQFKDKRTFIGYDREVWAAHVNYLLGERIYGYRACGLRLGWQELLTYEFEMRKHAIKRGNRGEAPFCEALKAAHQDPDLKQLFFTLPLSTMGKKDQPPRGEDNKRSGADRRMEQELKRLRAENELLRNRSNASSSGQAARNETPPPRKGTKGGEKGKGSGKDRRKAERLKEMRSREKLMLQLPNNGGLICYYFNIDSCSRGRECKFHHVCMRCGREGHGALDDRCPQIPNVK